LHMQLSDGQNRIILTDILGSKIFEDKVQSSYTMDMSAYKSGIYFLRVENAHGIQNIKIIKE